MCLVACSVGLLKVCTQWFYWTVISFHVQYMLLCSVAVAISVIVLHCVLPMIFIKKKKKSTSPSEMWSPWSQNATAKPHTRAGGMMPINRRVEGSRDGASDNFLPHCPSEAIPCVDTLTWANLFIRQSWLKTPEFNLKDTLRELSADVEIRQNPLPTVFLKHNW